MPTTPCSFVRTAVALLGLLALVNTAAAGSITLAWDPSISSNITHYRVFVGRVPGVYSEYYDVGPFQTSFVYQAPLDGISYYFAVAAAQGAVVGPKSSEVFAISPTLLPLVLGTLESARAIEPPADGPAPARDCQPPCAPTAARAQRLGEIGAMAAIRDGRLLFIEGGGVVRILGNDGSISGPALEASSPDARITALAADPRFASSRTVLVAETTTGPDGRRVTVSRYREIGNRLGEPAMIVPGLQLPDEGDAQITIDWAGFVYVAIPADTSRGVRNQAQGAVLRFALDGTVPRDNPGGTPEFARGPSDPRALLPGAGGDLWVVGEDPDAFWLMTSGAPRDAAESSPAFGARRSSGSPPAETVSAAVSSDTTTGESRFFTVDDAGVLWTHTAGSPSARLELGQSGVAATRVAAEPGGLLYVAVRENDPASSREGSWIVRLAAP